MKTLVNYFTSSYKDREHYIQVKANYTFYMLMLVCLTISLESFVAILFSTTDLIGVFVDLLSVLFFIGLLYILRSSHLILTGNLFILAGIAKMIEYYNLTYIHQFYIQCLIVLIVCIIIYIKPYQFYIIFGAGITTTLTRYYYIKYSIDISPELTTELLHQVSQASIGIIVFSIVMYFYDKVIKREIANGEKLKELAEIDVLTSLYNRQKFNTIMEKYVKDDLPYCLAIIDIDYFKKVNDRYGHSVGDDVLSKFALKLKAFFSNEEFLFRWGGEEFTIISQSEDTLDHFNAKLKDFIQLISVTDFDIPQVITVSVGLACSSQYPTLDRVLVHADKALYLAKSKGRNRVESIVEDFVYE